MFKSLFYKSKQIIFKFKLFLNQFLATIDFILDYIFLSIKLLYLKLRVYSRLVIKIIKVMYLSHKEPIQSPSLDILKPEVSSLFSIFNRISSLLLLLVFFLFVKLSLYINLNYYFTFFVIYSIIFLFFFHLIYGRVKLTLFYDKIYLLVGNNFLVINIVLFLLLFVVLLVTFFLVNLFISLFFYAEAYFSFFFFSELKITSAYILKCTTCMHPSTCNYDLTPYLPSFINSFCLKCRLDAIQHYYYYIVLICTFWVDHLSTLLLYFLLFKVFLLFFIFLIYFFFINFKYYFVHKLFKDDLMYFFIIFKSSYIYKKLIKNFNLLKKKILSFCIFVYAFVKKELFKKLLRIFNFLKKKVLSFYIFVYTFVKKLI